jgi:hypothetical protein
MRQPLSLVKNAPLLKHGLLTVFGSGDRPAKRYTPPTRETPRLPNTATAVKRLST